MTYTTKLKSIVKKWHRDEEGSIAVETILMVPLLAWAMLATLTYFDAYRNEAINYKAGLTIADAISRESDVDDDYIDGMYELLKFLMLKDDTPDLRITVFRYREDDDDYRTVWSESRGSQSALTNATIDSMRHRIPIMSDGERAILVETWSDYSAPYGVGLGDFDQVTYNVISPRFLPRTCFVYDDNSSDC